MSNVHTFTPRRPVVAPAPLPMPSPADIRHQIEDAAQAALDTVERLIALLDQMDGNPDAEDGGEAEPSLGAPENHHASQVVWLRGSSSDREQEAAR